MITAQHAQELLNHAERAEGFRQRYTSSGDIRRWRVLLETGRFVHYLPNGVLCTDENGVLLNGKHRLTAIIESGIPAGFVMFEGVPRWMFAYFDTLKPRTLKDLFHINVRATGPQTNSAIKLAVRYEEMLYGLLSPFGWRHWANQRDENVDLDAFLGRRLELQEWYGPADKLYRRRKILVPSTMSFLFYQGLAWPEGFDDIEDFLRELYEPENLSPQHPARKMAESTLNSYYNRESILAKRELHLLLLNRVFEQRMRGSRIDRIVWAYGHPMTTPYHPDGDETAIKNVRNALEAMDHD